MTETEFDFEDLAEQLEADAEEEKEVGLSDVAAAVEQYIVVNALLSDKEEEVKEIKKSMRAVEEEIRNLLNKAGLEKYDATDSRGRSVKITKACTASIAKAKEHVAFQWLRDNGFEDIIKNEVKVPFGRGSDSEARVLTKFLEENEIVFDENETVHAGTLKAFVNEQLGKGVEVPRDIFGVFDVIKVKLS